MKKIINMKDVVDRDYPDFIIKYELTEAVQLSFFPGCILNFAYDVSPIIEETFYDVFPEFYQGITSMQLVRPGESIPNKGMADMWIVSKRNIDFHQARLFENRKCYLLNGSHVVAKCRVIKVSREISKSQLQLNHGS